MVRHRGDFIEDLTADEEEVEHVEEGGRIIVNVLLLLVGLAGIVLLTEQVAGRIEDGLQALHVAQADAIVGFFIAVLVLMPEAVSAIKAALNNELQRGLNVALGSACATIGLTIPAVGVRQPDHRQEPDAWPGVRRYRASHPGAGHQRGELRHRADDDVDRARPSRRVLRLFVPDFRALAQVGCGCRQLVSGDDHLVTVDRDLHDLVHQKLLRPELVQQGVE